MDGAIGLIRVAFDFSVWPVDGHSQTAGSANIFTAADACAGSTCIPWHENMCAEHVVSQVVSHVLYNVAVTPGDPSKAPRLRREWSRVLRLALVVDHSVPAHLVHHHQAHPSSLVMVKPAVPLMQQPNVIQALHTSGTIRSLDTAIVVIPYDDVGQRQAAARAEAEHARKRRQAILDATTEEIDRRVARATTRNDAYRERCAALRAGFEAAGLGNSNSNNERSIDALEELAVIADKIVDAQRRKTESLRAMEGLDGQWKREVAVVEQSLSRVDGRIALFLGEKGELESELESILAMKRSRQAAPAS